MNEWMFANIHPSIQQQKRQHAWTFTFFMKQNNNFSSFDRFWLIIFENDDRIVTTTTIIINDDDHQQQSSKYTNKANLKILNNQKKKNIYIRNQIWNKHTNAYKHLKLLLLLFWTSSLFVDDDDDDCDLDRNLVVSCCVAIYEIETNIKVYIVATMMMMMIISSMNIEHWIKLNFFFFFLPLLITRCHYIFN